MDPNTKWVVDWCDRMMETTGLCGAVLCESLAEFVNESGEDIPSSQAIEVARDWECDHQKLYTVISESSRGCLSPTMGCIQHCDVWRAFPPAN